MKSLSLVACLLSSASCFAADDGSAGAFSRVSLLPIYETLAPGMPKATKTVAEIMSASSDGMTVMFTDSPGAALVFVDITDPAHPVAKGRAPLGGEPTSVAVHGDTAFAAVNTSQSYRLPAGHVAAIDVATRAPLQRCDVGGQPDSVAVSKDGKFLAVAVENERDEGLNDGALPQLPAGHLAIFDLTDRGAIANCDSARIVSLTGLSGVAPEDPEPEYVAINDRNEVVVTLQENNHLVVADLASGRILNHFSAGTATVAQIPTRKKHSRDTDGTITSAKREPDAVSWLDDDRFVTADEGDYEGGSRGFTVWNKAGDVLFESAALMEHLALMHGQYPQTRPHKKGTEPEATATGRFGGRKLFFINSERGNFVAAFEDTGATPAYRQFIPSHVKPEGILAIPSRNLLVISSEADDASAGVRAALTIFEFGAAEPSFPELVSATAKGAPIGWGRLSGLSPVPGQAGRYFAVHDGGYKDTRVYLIDTNQQPAAIMAAHTIGKGYDLQGVAVLGQDVWLLDAGRGRLMEARGGNLTGRQITANAGSQPAGLAACVQGTGAQLVVAYEDGKLDVVEPVSGKSRAVALPSLPSDAKVSAVACGADGMLYLAVGDGIQGPDAKVKQILAGQVEDLMGQNPTVDSLILVQDLLPILSGGGAWVPADMSGLAIAADGSLVVVSNNIGTAEAPGDTRFLHLEGAVQAQ